MKPTVLTALFLGTFILGCSEKEWECPQIEDALLLTTEYIADNNPYGWGDYHSFPHAGGDDGSFRASPDTTNGIITIKYRCDGKEIVEVWSLQKIR